MKLLVFIVSSAVISLFVGCEPELGSPCSADSQFIKSNVEQKTGSNDLVQNVNFENCSQAYCLSADGSRPFCTKRCQRDLDCDAAGFTCQQVVQFGQLACEDWSPELDCFDAEGNPSERPVKYCTAEPQIIEDRDEQCSSSFGATSCIGFGRVSEDIPSGWTCPAHWYGANDGCDCGCGAEDTDCAGTDLEDCDYDWCAGDTTADPGSVEACID